MLYRKNNIEIYGPQPYGEYRCYINGNLFGNSKFKQVLIDDAKKEIDSDLPYKRYISIVDLRYKRFSGVYEILDEDLEIDCIATSNIWFSSEFFKYLFRIENGAYIKGEIYHIIL